MKSKLIQIIGIACLHQIFCGLFKQAQGLAALSKIGTVPKRDALQAFGLCHIKMFFAGGFG